MAASSPVLTVVQKRSDLLVAGLTWHSLFETDLRERERKVTEFAQVHGIQRMCIIENPLGLQVGYCDRMNMPVTQLRRPRLFSMALAVKKFFDTRNLVLVWKVASDEVSPQYAIVIFESELLVLDYIATANTVEDVVTTYLENAPAKTDTQFMTNDSLMFPEFADISAFEWFSDTLDSAKLRPPRQPRLIDPEKRPVQAIAIFLALIMTCLVIAWYVWTEYVAKPKTIVVKPKPTPEQSYNRRVFEELVNMGWSSDTAQDVIMDIMQTPLVHEGWQLRQVHCSIKECKYLWISLEGSDPRALESMGKEIKRTVSPREIRIELSRRRLNVPSGLQSVEQLRSRADAELFCQRENLILRELGIKSSLQCTGVTWPEGAPKLTADLMVHRYPVSISGDWVSMDRIMERYADAVYWREIRVSIEPSRTDLLDLLQFELNGDLYGYR